MKQQTTKLDLNPVMNPTSDGTIFSVVIGLAVFATFFLFWFRRISKPAPEPQLTKVFDTDGYVVLLPIYEREHRYIAKQKVGRNLTSDEHVHHINGNKTDNKIENLCLMDSEKHEHFHAWLRWKKEKDGTYPSIRDQKRTLVQEYGGTLLENLSSGSHVKQCPGCNSLMVLRTAKKGKLKGKQFWGCTRYPTCRSSVAA
ncbi:MAG: HNH endonuclease [Bdellovibrionales bacterium]